MPRLPVLLVVALGALASLRPRGRRPPPSWSRARAAPGARARTEASRNGSFVTTSAAPADRVARRPRYASRSRHSSMTSQSVALSYSNPEATIDFGGPLSDKLAYRVSYLALGDGLLHEPPRPHAGPLRRADLLALQKNLKLEWWTQMYSDRTNENTGANRVTQSSSGTAPTSPARPRLPPAGPRPSSAFSTSPPRRDGRPPSRLSATTADGAYSVVDPATAYTVKLPAYDSLIGPTDTARSKLFQTQLKARRWTSRRIRRWSTGPLRLGGPKVRDLRLRRVRPPQQSIQDRLEFHDNLTAGPVENSLISGVDFRYSAADAYQDFTTEPFTYYDLSQTHSKIFYPGYFLEGNTWGGGAGGPRRPGYSGNASDPRAAAATSSRTSTTRAAFIQDDVKLGPQFRSSPGCRSTTSTADTATPSVVRTAITTTSPSIPLATPGLRPGAASPDDQGTTTPGPLEATCG